MVGQNSDAAASAVASALLEEEAAADAPRMRVEMVNFMIDGASVLLDCSICWQNEMKMAKAGKKNHENSEGAARSPERRALRR